MAVADTECFFNGDETAFDWKEKEGTLSNGHRNCRVVFSDSIFFKISEL